MNLLILFFSNVLNSMNSIKQVTPNHYNHFFIYKYMLFAYKYFTSLIYFLFNYLIFNKLILRVQLFLSKEYIK